MKGERKGGWVRGRKEGREGRNMGSNSLELSLSLEPTYVPKTISNLLKDLENIENESKKLSSLNDYLNQHQEELSKMKVSFLSRELPQCMLLLTEAIETLEEETRKIKKRMESAGSSKLPPLMEFMSMASKTHEEKDLRGVLPQNYGGQEGHLIRSSILICSPHHDKKQKAPLDNTQLPIQSPIWPHKEKVWGKKLFFVPSEGCSGENPRTIETIGSGGLNLKTDPQTLNYHPKPLTQPIWKNKRRSWSPELHARFVESLELLGGMDVATPKQIKDLMQVEGLTNTQVKSHLQKHRLQTRRYSETLQIPAKRSANQEEYRVSDICYNDVWMHGVSQSILAQEEHPGSGEWSGIPTNDDHYMGIEGGKLI